MSKRGKNKKFNKVKQVINLNAIVKFSTHAVERMKQRGFEHIDLNTTKRVTNQNAFKFPVLAQKYNSGIHNDTVYLVRPDLNLALAVVDNVICTVLNLDGSYGYNF